MHIYPGTLATSLILINQPFLVVLLGQMNETDCVYILYKGKYLLPIFFLLFYTYCQWVNSRLGDFFYLSYMNITKLCVMKIQDRAK